MQRWQTRLATVFADWRKDDNGVAAIEFAFIAPVMVLMFFGIFECARAYSIHRHFVQATATVGDLIARRDEVTDDELKSIFLSVPLMMGGYDNSTMKVEVIPLYIPASKPNDVYRLAIPLRRDGSSSECGVYAATSAEKLVIQSSAKTAIKVTASYEFQPVFNYPVIGKMTWKNDVLFSPRQEQVTFDDKRKCPVP